MGQLIYKTGNMLDAPVTAASMLVHSCNAAGEWGGGASAVATQLRHRYPEAYRAYQRVCIQTDWVDLQGLALVHRYEADAPYPYIASLIVSEGYGRTRSSEEVVRWCTQQALRRLLNRTNRWGGPAPLDFHSPKLNAGRFRVPWEQTVAVLRPLVEAAASDVTWTVWSLT